MLLRRASVVRIGVLVLVLVDCGSSTVPGAPDGAATDGPSSSAADSSAAADSGPRDLDSGTVSDVADAPDDTASSDATASDTATVDAMAHDGAGEASVDAAEDTAIPPLPTVCGVRTGMRGLTSRTLTVAGLARTYMIYLPASYDPTKPIPFVFVFHGYTMSGEDMYNMTQYSALADSEGIGLAFPDGEGGPNSIAFPWNVENPGQTVCGDGQFASAPGNDFAFIDAMKADVSQDQCLDPEHIFSSGFSMGAYFSEHIGCYRSDFRAISPHSGGTLADLSVCTNGHVPVILFHGTVDNVIAEACDDPTSPSPVAGFPASATLWAKKNGCASTYKTVPNQGAGGGLGQCYVYDGCPADGQVELCTFTGMAHCWAGGTAAGSGGNACPTYADATQLQWTFFKTYAW